MEDEILELEELEVKTKEEPMDDFNWFNEQGF
jgi:hypothetical protein